MKLKNGERLTKKVAKRVCLELWEDLAKTGGDKAYWKGWEKYGEMRWDCPLCEYHRANDDEEDCVIGNCPLAQKKVTGCLKQPYHFAKWDGARQVGTRKKYAKLFLEELRKIC